MVWCEPLSQSYWHNNQQFHAALMLCENYIGLLHTHKHTHYNTSNSKQTQVQSAIAVLQKRGLRQQDLSEHHIIMAWDQWMVWDLNVLGSLLVFEKIYLLTVDTKSSTDLVRNVSVLILPDKHHWFHQKNKLVHCVDSRLDPGTCGGRHVALTGSPLPCVCYLSTAATCLQTARG